jgi:hypothetical protein
MSQKVRLGNKTETLRQGISSIHDITWDKRGATHRQFTSLDTDEKVIDMVSWPIEHQPTYTAPLGTVLDRHVNMEDPIFFAFKESQKANEIVAGTQKKDPAMLSTRIYNALMRYSAGMDAQDGQADDVRAERARKMEAWIREAKDASEDILFILEEDKETIQLFDDAFDHPITLDRNWARKQNRDSDFWLSTEIKDILVSMFKQGQGEKNKNIRYTAERALMELQHEHLQYRWDQRRVVQLGKIKSFFSQKYAREKRGNDEMRAATAEQALSTKREQGEKLLTQCKECEDLVRSKAKDGNLEEARIEDFFRAPAPLLKAFIKARLLDDAGSREMDNKMPRKGSLAENRDDTKVCSKTGRPLLARWAHQLRAKPVKADLKVDESSLDAEIDHFLLENQEFIQTVDFIEDLAGEMLQDTENQIVVDEEGTADEEGKNDTRDDSDASDVSEDDCSEADSDSSSD